MSMTKNKAIKILNDLKKDELEAIEQYNEAIKSFADHPEVISSLSWLHQDEVRHLGELENLIKRCNSTQKEIEEYKVCSDMCCSVPCEAPIIFEEEEKEE